VWGGGDMYRQKKNKHTDKQILMALKGGKKVTKKPLVFFWTFQG
jgi:hypothetical protein